MKKIVLLLLVLAFTGCRKEKKFEVGESDIVARHFLSDEHFRKLNVELSYPAGFRPTDKAVSEIRAFLQKYLNKPDGIEIGLYEVAGMGKETVNLEEIRAHEKSTRRLQSKGDELTAYIFFADAEYAENSGNAKVLGIHYGPTSMVVFEKTLKKLGGGLTQPPLHLLETCVSLHEFGHAMGLVDNGTPEFSEHEDGAHPRHCSNKECLMYYAAETGNVVENLLSGKVPALDGNCENDLRRNGGK